MHGSTGGGWKRNASASPRQSPTQPSSGLPVSLKNCLAKLPGRLDRLPTTGGEEDPV
jgi:hypothetical protein